MIHHNKKMMRIKTIENLLSKIKEIKAITSEKNNQENIINIDGKHYSFKDFVEMVLAEIQEKKGEKQ
jgi:hypothetical protein